MFHSKLQVLIKYQFITDNVVYITQWGNKNQTDDNILSMHDCFSLHVLNQSNVSTLCVGDIIKN